ncbi:MAG TPA: hypothetical protein VMB25_17215 [Bryobacteraceae bacterium]|nr:hypothetical protein [Bryobacteraceae bacterium]
MSNLTDLAEPTPAQPEHPPAEILEVFATNDMGPRRKKKVVQHLEGCAECRSQLAKIREARRRVRDLLRLALAVR